MKVRFTRAYAGPQGSFSEGQQADIDPAFASMLVRYNTAVYVDKPADVINTVATPSDGSGAGDARLRATSTKAEGSRKAVRGVVKTKTSK